MIGQGGNGQRVLGWSMHAADALRAAVKKFGSQEGVAEQAGISRPSLVEILQGRSTPKVSTLQAICTVIGVEPSSILAAQPAPALPNMMQLRDVDLAYGMGGTFIDDLSVVEVFQHLPADWVRQFTRAPADQLFLCRGIGDSMMPTLLDSDLLLVDQSQDTLKQSDRIWVLTVGDVGMVKRVRVMADGNLAILSDNASVPEMIAVDGEARLVGRVVAVIRKL